MLSSKRITLISIILMAIALIGVIILMANPALPEKQLGEVSYENGQTIVYSSIDYYSDYNAASFSKILLNGTSAFSESKNVQINGGNITINGGGVYVLSGTLEGGSVTVNAEDGAVVQLVLCGADISSADSPAIYVEQAEKTVISMADGSVNTITDSSQYEDSGLDAAIYSRDDLVFNGGGTLVINANYADAVKVNDALKIMDGDIRITSADEAISVNDYIAFNGGVLTVTSGGDAIKCVNNDDASLGFIAFEGGEISIDAQTDGIYAGSDIYVNKVSASISCGEDAVHAGKTLLLNDGEIDISKCTEGLEGAYITVNGGKYNIISSDDAMNATGESSVSGGMGGPPGGSMSTEIYLTVNGGEIYAQTGGDGLDSNAAAAINGGYIEIYGPENNGNSTLDFDGGFSINGGTVIAAGSSGMAESPSEGSTQNSIVVTLDERYKAGTRISLKDENGSEIAAGVPAKSFDWVCISSSEIEIGATYTLSVGEEEVEAIEVTTSVSKVGNSSFGGRRF